VIECTHWDDRGMHQLVLVKGSNPIYSQRVKPSPSLRCSWLFCYTLDFFVGNSFQ